MIYFINLIESFKVFWMILFYYLYKCEEFCKNVIKSYFRIYLVKFFWVFEIFFFVRDDEGG